MKMGVRYSDHGIVLSCPGCEHWQVDYTQIIAMEFIDSGGTKEWHLALEAVLVEHMAACEELQAIYGLL